MSLPTTPARLKPLTTCRMCGVAGDALVGNNKPWCTRCESLRQACEARHQKAMLRVWEWHPEDHDAAWETVV